MPRRSLRYRLVRAAISLVTVYLLVMVLMMIFEERLVFIPDRYPGPDAAAWKPTGIIVEDANFTAADGTKLHGWFVPHPDPRVVILYAPGNAGNVTYRDHFLAKLHRLGAATLIFDYRGYGKSEGSPTEAGILQDGRAARAWLAERMKTTPDKIVLLGESLGGGVAVDLAASDGAAGLILLSTFTSLPDVAAKFYPWLPVKLVMRTRLDSLAKIGNYQGPVLQAHGDNDEIIPFAIGQQLYDAAPDPDKTFIKLVGSPHNYDWPGVLVDGLDKFFTRVSGKPLADGKR